MRHPNAARAGAIATFVLLTASAGAQNVGQTTVVTPPPPPASTPDAGPKVYSACYIPIAGTVYRIKEPGLPQRCFLSTHLEFSWNERGPAGPAGAAGVQGPPGVPCADGCVTSAALAPNAVTGDKVLDGHLVRSLNGLTDGVTLAAGSNVMITPNGQTLTISAAGGSASGTSANTPNTLVQRDANGDFAAGALTLTGKLDQTSDAGLVATGTFRSGAIPATGAGVRLMWYPGKAAFRAGRVFNNGWDDASVGEYSVATGNSTLASGSASTAMGQQAAATATGSTAMGISTTASNFASTALGYITEANGPNSTAMGSNASTNGQTGAFVYGDASNLLLVVTAAVPNEFVVRAAGGFRFRTSSDLSTGCNLPAGSGVFQCTSSRALKTGFRDVDGEALLARMATIPVTTWRYRTESDTVRHMGPVAEDFRAAFGLGTGSTSIGLLDISGVTFAGVQALERRTRALAEENTALRAQLVELLRRVERLEHADDHR